MKRKGVINLEDNKKISQDDVLALLCLSSYNFIRKSNLSFIKFYDSKYKRIERKLIQHKEKEPLKCFKKAHADWNEQLNSLTLELNKTLC